MPYKDSKKRKECVNKSTKKYYSNNLEKYQRHRAKYYIEVLSITKQLKINGCAICGYNECQGALHFHHTNPEDKLFSVSGNHLLLNPETVARELNKCILLCANCHAEIHWGE